MGRLRRMLWLLALWTSSLAACAHAQDQVRTFREWESFQPGAWKFVRIHRETFDAEGNVASRSITETRTTLTELDADGFTLTIDVTVEVAGQRFTSPAQSVWYGYNGEAKGQNVTSQKVGSEQLEIDNRKIDVDLYRVSIQHDKTRRELQAACSKDFPFVFRLQSALIEQNEGAEASRELETTRAAVMSLDVPFLVLGQFKTTSHVRTILERADSQTVTLEVHCEEVPGHVVAHWAKKVNATGGTLERSVLELVDYGLDGRAQVQNRRE